MKEKLAMFLVSAVCVTSCVAVTGLAIKNSTGDHPAIIKAEDKVYSLTIDSPLYTGAETSGVDYTTVKTTSGTDIKLKYNKLSPFEAGEYGVQSGFNTMSNGSYIEIVSNEDIHGLGGVRNIQFNSTIKEVGRLKVNYGWKEGVYANYKEIVISPNEENPVYDISLPDNLSYIKIEVTGSYLTKMGLGSIIFTYSCEEITNPYALVDDFYLGRVEDHYEVISYVGTNTVLTVPGEYDDLPVTAIADGFKTLSYNVKDVEQVVLPVSVTKIGYEAFFCDANDTGKLSRINLGNVTYIAARAFLNNDYVGKYGADLRKVSFIGESAFFGTSFTNETVTFNASNVEIQSLAFRLSGVGTVEFGSTTSVSLRGQAFSKCSSLRTVRLPKNTVYLGGLLFEDTPNLYSINYNGTVEEFNTIEKAPNWQTFGTFSTVICSNGDIIIDRTPKN